MKRNTLNFLIDLVSALVMLGMIATGLLVRFVLPPGSGSRRSLWGFGRHDWGDMHFWLAAAVGVLVVVHVALHWQWVCVTVMRWLPRRADAEGVPGAWRRNLSGAALLVVLVGFFSAFVWVAGRNVKDHSALASEPGHEQTTGNKLEELDHSIKGSMTLSEAATACGISVETARTRLGASADLPAGEQLGRLSRRLGMSMSELRRKLADPAIAPH